MYRYVTSIRFNPNTATVGIARTLTLPIPTILPIGPPLLPTWITWSTSNSNIATVENGVVTGVSAGTAIITARSVPTSTDGTNKTGSVTVTVPAPVTGVSINPSTWIMDVRTAKSMIATIAPATVLVKTVDWTTSNPTVATVNIAGVVTAVANGTATITATSRADNTKFATCSLTVVSVVRSISLRPTSVKLSISNTSPNSSTYTLPTPTFTPLTATNQTYYWINSGGQAGIVSITNGVITAQRVGTASLIAITQDGGRTGYLLVTVVA
jgi:uncharacterized protein YjdB